MIFFENAFVISLKNKKKGTIIQILLSDRIYVAAVYYRAKYHSTFGYSTSCLLFKNCHIKLSFQPLLKELWMINKFSGSNEIQSIRI